MKENLFPILPFHLNEKIPNQKDNLKYLGILYYEQFAVYEIIKKPIDNVFNFRISKIDVLVQADIIVGLNIYLNVNKHNSMFIKDGIDMQLKETGKMIFHFDSLVYMWSNEVNILVLTSSIDKEVVLEYHLKQYSSYSELE